MGQEMEGKGLLGMGWSYLQLESFGFEGL